jgi:hypothetical protein
MRSQNLIWNANVSGCLSSLVERTLARLRLSTRTLWQQKNIEVYQFKCNVISVQNCWPTTSRTEYSSRTLLLTWLFWDWQCENFCTHKAEAEIIACTWLTLYSLPNHGLTSSSRFALIKQWLCLLMRQEDDGNTWQMNMLMDTSLHLIKYYHTCVFTKIDILTSKLTVPKTNLLHSKKSRI